MIPRSSGPFRDVAVELEGHPLYLVEPLLADERDGGRAVDVLVVARLGLGRRREDRLRQLVGLGEPGGQRVPADLAGGAVVLPARSGEIAANDAFDREHLEPAALGRASVVGEREQVVRDDPGGLGEPEPGEPGQHAPLVGDLGGQYDVERGDPVARDEQQTFLVERVDLTDLSARDVAESFRH